MIFSLFCPLMSLSEPKIWKCNLIVTGGRCFCSQTWSRSHVFCAGPARALCLLICFVLIAAHLSRHTLALVKVSACISHTPIIALPLADLAGGSNHEWMSCEEKTISTYMRMSQNKSSAAASGARKNWARALAITDSVACGLINVNRFYFQPGTLECFYFKRQTIEFI